VLVFKNIQTAYWGVKRFFALFLMENRVQRLVVRDNWSLNVQIALYGPEHASKFIFPYSKI